MSYREENGQVVLTMSREDYEALIFRLGLATGYLMREGAQRHQIDRELELLNRLNQGNPNYTPYEVAEK
jgi:hypothetical protein